ncbi:putative GINS complex, subunit Psf3, GINS subunit, domain A, GINS complex, subunit Psf3 superfamily [Helianthus annuus]|uniref:GINS complex, subunit Psf3, GINS subunit, domain A, GINS complex, subunit Psf3 superfamily n=1 Tax=Helianthus annuus TaxID=4232 RepID=A0A251TZA5_HELAN|nr:DNA replication complex GINS protein PSF3 [Helianthus annuus]KAF5792808.1 putative GINS complex, subunit Psf3, GINS subunit, domain A, GINS complex, subunit Psf3 superfamily [Helianthus annuus]KAJ0544123.1 putative GINS complex, subunit Psf3, GINS subunit, domain A, GINS complex, subunit Psf3 superfamily [Helianthus annuus]
MGQYHDIDDILADEELVPAVFLEAVNGVGLFESNDTNRVEPRSKVELPFWLASELHLRQVTSVSIPPCFDKKTREEIGADGAHVDLRSRCSYFYELGCKIVQLINEKTIGSLLLVAFQTRYKEVLIKAHTSASALAPKYLSLLTKEETKLYEAAKSSTEAFKTWRMGGPRFQKASVLGRKRKPIGE